MSELDYKRPISLIVAFIATIILLAGCVVRPDPLTDAEIEAETQYNQDLINALQQLPDGPITLSEAMAYGVVYNLDNRISLAEEAIGMRQLDFSRWSFYPQLTLNGGYSFRDNTPGSFSRSLLTGRESLERSTSQDRERTFGDLQLAWNLLDFGVSYFTARQQANQVLILRERQRRVLQELIHDIRDAYWRVVAYQKLVSAIEPLSERLEMAIAQAETVEQEGLQTEEPLLYRQNLYTKLSQIETLREGLVAARANLNQLMNLPPTFATEVVELENEIQFEPLDLSMLEDIALRHRPEIREANYQKRISSDEIKKSTVRMFPGLEVSMAYNQDSNSFLNNADWGTAGVRITWNLLNLLNGREQLELDRAREELQQIRNIALNMSILAQVNIAYVNYEQASRQFEINTRLADISERLQNIQSDSFNVQVTTELDLIQSELDLLLANLRRDESITRIQSAYSQLQLAIGENRYDDMPNTNSIDRLAEYLAEKESLTESAVINEEAAAELVENQVIESASVAASEEQEAQGEALVLEQIETDEPEQPVVDETNTNEESSSIQPLVQIPGEETEESLLAFVQLWLASWEAQNVTAYYSFYEDDFDSLYHDSYLQWRADRQFRISSPASIALSFDNFETVLMEDGRAIIRFMLYYDSQTYQDETLKELRLVLQDGMWQIEMERNVDVTIIRQEN